MRFKYLESRMPHKGYLVNYAVFCQILTSFVPNLPKCLTAHYRPQNQING